MLYKTKDTQKAYYTHHYVAKMSLSPLKTIITNYIVFLLCVVSGSSEAVFSD